MTDLANTPDSESSEEYIAAIMDRDSRQKAAVPPPAPDPMRAKKRLLSILLPLAIIGVAWNISRVSAAPTLFSPIEEEAGAKIFIYEAVLAIQAFRDSTGALPANLLAAGLEDEPIVYLRSGDSFRIEAEANGQLFLYRDGDDLRPFEEAYRVFARGTR